ncbi:MAG: inner membrane protein YpjD [Brachymonas sp.]
MMILSTGLTPWFVVLAVLSLVAYILPAFKTSWSAQAVRTCLLMAWMGHGALLVLSLLSGRFGFGPALSVMAWLVLTVYAVEGRLYPQMQSRRVLAVLGALALLVGLVFPGAQMGQFASAWLPLHAALGIAAYGMLAVATVHAWLMQSAEAKMRLGQQSDAGLPLMTLERLMLAFVVVSWALLTGTLLAGWLFAEDLYGIEKFWKWDHKTIFSLLAWVVLACLLWGRWQRGWRGRHAARFVYGGAILLLLAYVGSRFVLEVLLDRMN